MADLSLKAVDGPRCITLVLSGWARRQVGKTTNPDALRELVQALQALAAKLTEAQAQEALAPLLQQIGKTTNPDALRELVQALQAVAAKLTEAQTQQVLAPLLQQIVKTIDPDTLRAAEALQAMAGKLTEAQTQQALAVAMSSLAWAANEDEAVDWARAVVALLSSAADHADQGGTRKLVSAIVYALADRGHDTRELQAYLGTKTFNTLCAILNNHRLGSRKHWANAEARHELERDI